LVNQSHILESEFAAVRMSVDLTAKGPRLTLVDIATGSTVFLDPLLLSALARGRLSEHKSLLRAFGHTTLQAETPDD
jgi:hypothetical protein